MRRQLQLDIPRGLATKKEIAGKLSMLTVGSHLRNGYRQ